MSNFKKIEVPETFQLYDVDEDPDEKVEKPSQTAKKGTLVLPKSSAFGSMMRAEMNAATLQGPRKLKKDDYKEYMVETIEEKKALTAKPAVKSKAAPKNSWRSGGGFKIPTKEEQKQETQQYEEAKQLTPAPTEYKLPQQKQPQQNNQNTGGQGNQNKNKNRNRNKNKKGKGGKGGEGQNQPHQNQSHNQQQNQQHNQYDGQQNQYNQYQQYGYQGQDNYHYYDY